MWKSNKRVAKIVCGDEFIVSVRGFKVMGKERASMDTEAYVFSK